MTVEALVNQASALKALGRLEEAERCAREAVRRRPDLAEAQCNLGAVLLEQDRLAEAEAACRRALELKPELAEALSNLAAILLRQDRVEEARICCEEAVRLKPSAPEALNNLGNVWFRQGRLAEAKAWFRRAIQADPNYFEARLNLAGVLRELGQLPEAIASGREAVRLRPASAEAHNNLGDALRAEGRVEQAQACFREALRLNPRLPRPYLNLSGTLRDQGRLEEAVEMWRRGAELQPDYGPFHLLHNDLLWEPEEVFREHLRWAERYAAPLGAAVAPHPNDRDPERRLRVGYVSPDFRGHSVAFFSEPLLAAHDRHNFEIYCYADVRIADPVTERIRRLPLQWRDLYGTSDADAAELIRRDRIDILVDLAGHTTGNRLMVFARKPAPVQVTYLGYPDTTGLRTIDYRLTDGWADPPGRTEHLHTEELVRLPRGAWCYRPPEDAPEASPLPARSSGTVTFGCFNNLAKVTPRLIAAWAEILRRTPQARLIVKSPVLVDGSTRRLVLERFRQHGLADGHVQLFGPVKREHHLGLYQWIDLALDTFPYHGTTTTCEALWMGVPVVVLEGATHASRVGVSLLSSVGLADWIAADWEGYVELAARRACELAGLAELRAGLRARMSRAPLTDAQALSRDLEEAYRRMWRRWCAS